MEIVGYVAYASLVIMAIVWTIAIRKDLVAETPAILRAVYFVTALAVMTIFEINRAHALWIIPFGCFFSRIIAPALMKIPVVSMLFGFIAGIYAYIARTGVPRQKILAARSALPQNGPDEP